MPCNDDEVDMNAPEAVPPCTPPKATGNGGAGRVDPDGQMNSDSEDSDKPSGTPRKFFSGIYQVYTRYILFPLIFQEYTRYIPAI